MIVSKLKGTSRSLPFFLLAMINQQKSAPEDVWGVFKDPKNHRYGMIYQPPRYIESFWTTEMRDYALAQFCKPVSLLNLLERCADPNESESILDLGIRFILAKTLVRSVLILHAAGWLHKKYNQRLPLRNVNTR